MKKNIIITLALSLLVSSSLFALIGRGRSYRDYDTEYDNDRSARRTAAGVLGTAAVVGTVAGARRRADRRYSDGRRRGQRKDSSSRKSGRGRRR